MNQWERVWNNDLRPGERVMLPAEGNLRDEQTGTVGSVLGGDAVVHWDRGGSNTLWQSSLNRERA